MKPGRLSGLTEDQKDYGMNCSPYKLLHVEFLSPDEYGNILQSQIWSETICFVQEANVVRVPLILLLDTGRARI